MHRNVIKAHQQADLDCHRCNEQQDRYLNREHVESILSNCRKKSDSITLASLSKIRFPLQGMAAFLFCRIVAFSDSFVYNIGKAGKKSKNNSSYVLFLFNVKKSTILFPFKCFIHLHKSI